MSGIDMLFGIMFSWQIQRGAVVRAEAQISNGPCVPGSNPNVGRGCGLSDETV
jgi:hypothetical protein